MRSAVIVIASALTWTIAGATAAIAAAPAPQPATACDLQVWPASALEFFINPIGILFRGQAKITPMGYDVEDLLSPSAQNRIFIDMDLAKMLGMPGAAVTYHNAALDAHERRDNGRRLASPSACYAELIVSKLFYAETGMGGRQIQAILLFRRFDAGASPTREFLQSGQTLLRIFPPHNQEPLAPALAEVVDGFKADVQMFAAKLAAAPVGSQQPAPGRGR